MSLPAPSRSSVALVTGASAGIGAEFARQLHARGYRVALVARREDRLRQLAAQLDAGDGNGSGSRVIAVAADLALAPERDRLAARLEELGAEVQVLVNSAGIGVYGAFAETDRERELQQVRLDVEAVVDLMSRYLPGMVRRGAGAIINMSSTSGFQPSPYNAGYSAAKAHVLLLSEAVNEEVKGSGVTVTAVCPGPVPTEFQDANDARFAEKLPKFTWASPERVVADALRAAERGRRTIVPGGVIVKAALGSGRRTPSAVSLAVAKRLLKPS